MDRQKMIPAGPPIPDHYPAAVPSELFWRVQALLSERAPKGKRTDGGYRNFLSGMLKCGYCKGTFTLDKKAGQDAIDKFFYSCMNSSTGVAKCDNRINYKTLLLGGVARTSGRYKRPTRLSLMQALLEHLYTAGHNPAMQTQKQDIEVRIGALDSQRMDAESRKQRLLDAIETGTIPLEDVATRLDKLRSEESRLKTEVEKSRVHLASVGTNNDWIVGAIEEEMEKVIACINDLGAIDQRAEFRMRLQRAIESIQIYKDHATLQLRGSGVQSIIPLTDTFTFKSKKQPRWESSEKGPA